MNKFELRKILTLIEAHNESKIVINLKGIILDIKDVTCKNEIIYINAQTELKPTKRTVKRSKEEIIKENIINNMRLKITKERSNGS